MFTNSVNIGTASQLMEEQTGSHREVRDLTLVQPLGEDGPVLVHRKGPHIGTTHNATKK
jgi:hypothetical protein